MATSISTTAADRAQPLTPIDVALLEAFTPVDARVAWDLGPEVAVRHVSDLCKRLSLAAELSAPGIGADLLARALDRTDDADRLLGDIDALLEFGCLAEDLDGDQLPKAQRAEVRQEIRHFDRIMDLNSLRTSRLALKTRREFAFQEGDLGAAERLLVLVQERQMLAGRSRVAWRDLSAPLQREVTMHGEAGASMRRSRAPIVAAATWAASAPQARTLLLRLEELATRHPVAVALALVDYEAFVNHDAPAHAVVASLTPDGNEARADVRAAGRSSWCLFAKDDFELRLLARGRLDGLPCGGRWSRMVATEIAVPQGARLLVAADGGRLAETVDLEATLNRRRAHGRVDVSAALHQIIGARPFTWVRQPSARHRRQTGPDSSEVGFEPFIASMLETGRPLHLSIECGHVHADREVGEAQMRGLRTGSALVTALREGAEQAGTGFSVDATPMVDDDHVLNRLRFADYEALFASHGLVVHDLILESSPLLRAVAHDVLRQALHRQGTGYDLELIGGNLYLEAPGLRLELVEDVEADMRNGCVLFEVGLVIYRAVRQELAPAFERLLGAGADSVHRRMAVAYDAAADPEERDAIRARFAGMYQDDWDQVQRTSDVTPLLDRYREVLARRRASGEQTVVLNVLENYYRPQQEKVLRLARLLDIELPLWAAFFSPYGRGLEWMRPCAQTDDALEAAQ